MSFIEESCVRSNKISPQDCGSLIPVYAYTRLIRHRARKSRGTLQNNVRIKLLPRPTIFTRCDLDFLAPSTKRVPQQNESLHFSSGNGFTSTYGFGNKFMEIMPALYPNILPLKGVINIITKILIDYLVTWRK